MIQIQPNLTIDKIENLYRELYRDSKDQIVDICLPQQIESTDFGVIPSLIQFASTWIRNPNAGVLLLNIQDVEVQIAEFMQQDYAFPIITMSWKKGIYLIDRKTDLKKILKKYTTVIHHEMRSLGNIRKNKLLLTCFDHLSENNGLLDCFYINDRFIQSEDVLSFTLVPSLLKALAFNRAALKKNLTPITDHLISIIYELMKNTDDWARTDKSNKPFNPNIRGLFVRFIKKRKDTFIENYKDHEGFKDYFNEINSNELGEQYFAEISVFDSGSGFVNKYPFTPENPRLEQRVDIIKTCLLRHSTAAQGLSAHGKGQGLDKILNILDDKGLLWIRTDRVSLYRNVKKDRYELTTSKGEVDLYDWNTHIANEFTEQELVSGSNLTIIYPIL